MSPRLSCKYVIHLLLLLLNFQISGCVSNLDRTLTPIQNASDEGCYLESYSDPKMSEYILPYEVGKSFRISQGNCGRYLTHRPHCTAFTSGGVTINCGDLRYSYDFAIPIGIKILAARGGVVIDSEDRFSNSTNGTNETNLIFIEHSDGSAGIYVHLSPNGVLVELGDTVSQGDVIGIAGNSGFTAGHPHLHFSVITPPFDKCRNGVYSGCKTIPITFKNAEPLDAPLIEDSTYEAIPY